MTAPSETPRTEAAIEHYGSRLQAAVPIDFARQVERELAAAVLTHIQDRDYLRSELEHYKIQLTRVTAERDAALSDATRWRKHCDVMRRGDVALLVRVLFDITAEEYGRTLDFMKERDK